MGINQIVDGLENIGFIQVFKCSERCSAMNIQPVERLRVKGKPTSVTPALSLMFPHQHLRVSCGNQKFVVFLQSEKPIPYVVPLKGTCLIRLAFFMSTSQ